MKRSSRHRSIFSLRQVAVAAALVAAFGTARSAPITWEGPNDSFWDLVANWNPGLPGVGDEALLGAFNTIFRSGGVSIGSLAGAGTLTVSGGQLSVANASSTAGLTITGGLLGGAGNLSVSGAASWMAGTHTGAGTTQFNNDLSISGAGSKVISGTRTIDLSGTTTWSGNTANNNGAIQFASGTLNNNGSFNDQNTFASFLDHGSGNNAFNNIGTYNKQSNTVTTVEVVYNNSGTTNVNAGTILMQGTSTSTGTINIALGAAIEFRNGTHTLNNTTTSGAGTLVISTDNVGANASVTINGGTLGSSFLLSSSTLTGSDQVFQGSATWTGGTITGAASTTFDNTLAISGPNGKTLSGGRTVNAGNTTWSGNTGNNNNAMSLASTSVFNSTGTFTDTNAFDSSFGGGTFNNGGTFNKQSNTTTSMGTVFNNTGTVNVNAGTMLMQSGGVDTGLFSISDGAKLEFRNGAHTLNNVTTSGAGTFQISTENVGADAVVTVNGGDAHHLVPAER